MLMTGLTGHEYLAEIHKLPTNSVYNLVHKLLTNPPPPANRAFSTGAYFLNTLVFLGLSVCVPESQRYLPGSGCGRAGGLLQLADHPGQTVQIQVIAVAQQGIKPLPHTFRIVQCLLLPLFYHATYRVYITNIEKDIAAAIKHQSELAIIQLKDDRRALGQIIKGVQGLFGQFRGIPLRRRQGL